MRPSRQDRVVRLDNAVHLGGTLAIELIIMHLTAGGSALSSIEYLNSTADKKASYNYVIEREGTIYRMVRSDRVAYHAGDSAWPNPIRATPANPNKPNHGASVNGRSLGLAFANNGEPLTDEAIESMLWLCAFFMEKENVPLENVLGHCEVSPGRKPDPEAVMPMDEWRLRLTAYLESE